MLSLGLGIALSSTSCVTCPGGQQSCGTANAGPAEAGAGGEDEATCDVLTAMRRCMDAYCKTASNPFCTCYKRHYFLSTDTCKCVELDTKRFCDQAEGNGVDATTYDCSADSSAVSSFCVGVN